MAFQIQALPMAEFEPFFALSDSELLEVRAARVVADAKPGFPCRVSLVDAEIGESLILINFEHQPGDSPFRSAHAIFVREHAEQSFPEVDRVPELIESRLMSIRAFDEKDFLVDADVVEGSRLRDVIPEMLEDHAVEYLHLHYAKPGCFAAKVVRA